MSIVQDDLIERSVDIHWPDGYDPGHADLFAHNAIASSSRAKGNPSVLGAALALVVR